MLPVYPCPEAVVQKCSVEKVFLQISQNSQENTCARVSFFDKVAGLRPATLLKKRLWHRYFPVKFVKFLKTPFFIEHLWWLVLNAVLVNLWKKVVELSSLHFQMITFLLSNIFQ